MFPIHTILHPTDFSESSEQALHIACSLARDHGAKLVIVTVLEMPLPVGEAFLMAAQMAAATHKAKEGLAQVAASVQGIAEESRLLTGPPAEAIVEAAKDCHANLIVMGTVGRTGLNRLVMGSVAEQVLRHAPCPVLAIKSGTSAQLDVSECAAETKTGAPECSGVTH